MNRAWIGPVVILLIVFLKLLASELKKWDLNRKYVNSRTVRMVRTKQNVGNSLCFVLSVSYSAVRLSRSYAIKIRKTAGIRATATSLDNTASRSDNDETTRKRFLFPFL